jgi:ribosomal protein S18 acetylase RimI-like enzyme
VQGHFPEQRKASRPPGSKLGTWIRQLYTEPPLAAELRGRVPWYWLPLAALLAAALSYALHHTLPWNGHDLEVAIVVAAAVALSVAAGLVARPAERQLPIVVTVHPESVGVSLAGPRDVGFCAALHAQALDQGIFSALGHGFLRAYYSTFVASPHAIALLARAGGVPVGMVVGIVDPRSHTRWVMRRRGLRLAARGAAMLLVRPRIAVSFVRTRLARYRTTWRRTRSDSVPPKRSLKQHRTAVLSHIAVVPGGRGAGVGRALVDEFLAAARGAGVDSVTLVTRQGDDGAGAFYSRLGWRDDGARVTFDGQPVAAFTIDLAAHQS